MRILIYEKILEYKNTIPLKKPKMPFHLKIADRLLEKKKFKLLDIYRKLLNYPLNMPIIKKKLTNRSRIKVKKDDEIYSKIKT